MMGCLAPSWSLEPNFRKSYFSIFTVFETASFLNPHRWHCCCIWNEKSRSKSVFPCFLPWSNVCITHRNLIQKNVGVHQLTWLHRYFLFFWKNITGSEQPSFSDDVCNTFLRFLGFQGIFGLFKLCADVFLPHWCRFLWYYSTRRSQATVYAWMWDVWRCIQMWMKFEKWCQKGQILRNLLLKKRIIPSVSKNPHRSYEM
jgi:hypothetical protein